MKNFALALGLLLTSSCILADEPQQVFSHSFMFTRPAYEHMSMIQATWHSIIYNKRGPIFGSFQVIPFYNQSIPLNKTAHYFLPGCKNPILIAGDSAPDNTIVQRDVRAEWLGLNATFSGFMSLEPRQRQGGVTLEYNQDLRRFFDFEMLKDYWISVTMPVLFVENNINICQSGIVPGSPTTGQPVDIIQAFNQQAWGYAKMDGKDRQARAAELRFTLGSALVSKNYFQFAYNAFFVAPMGNRQNGRYIFETVVGNNQHVSFGGAIFFQFPMNEDLVDEAYCFFVNLETQFLIRNKQNRTFDLRNKPWSRYLLYNEQTIQGVDGASNVPGVNLLTRRAQVRPFGLLDMSTGFRFMWSIFEVELSYNLWGKSSERVRLLASLYNPCDCYSRFFGIAGNAPGTTASLSTIYEQAANDLDPFSGDPVFIPVLDSDLDEHSAESSAVINHKAQLSIGAIWKGESADTLFDIAGFVEYPQKNSALFNWGVWCKVGASF
jgi:hypothetical protein